MISSYCLVTSCSSNEQDSSSNAENAKVTTFLKSFYHQKHQLGRSVERVKANNSTSSSSLMRTTEIENLIVTEVFVGNDTRARGYIITDKSTNEFLYFIDVDRLELKLTTIKIEVNETIVFENIDYLDKYLSTDEFDYIKIAEDYNVTEQSQRGKFWGWGNPVLSSQCVNGQRAWVQYYYVLGVNTGSSRPVRGLDDQPMYAPCE